MICMQANTASPLSLLVAALMGYSHEWAVAEMKAASSEEEDKKMKEEEEETEEESEEEAEEMKTPAIGVANGLQKQIDVDAAVTIAVDAEIPFEVEAAVAIAVDTEAEKKPKTKKKKPKTKKKKKAKKALVERRIVLFLPGTCVDDNTNACASTMTVLGRHRSTKQELLDKYFPLTELTVEPYFKLLRRKYEAAAGGDKHYPQVFVEDYQTGDNCVFIPEHELKEILKFDDWVQHGMIPSDQVPSEYRVENAFRGVRQRPHGYIGQSLTKTPLAPMDPELLCSIRGVEFSDAAAAAQAAVFKTEEARFEERLMAQELKAADDLAQASGEPIKEQKTELLEQDAASQPSGKAANGKSKGGNKKKQAQHKKSKKNASKKQAKKEDEALVREAPT